MDYVQSIGYRNGRYEIYYKFTVSKALLALGEDDPDTACEQLGKSDVFKQFRKSSLNKVETDIDMGYEVNISIDPRNASEEEKSFLPKVKDNVCLLPFFPGKNRDSFSESISKDNYEEKAMSALVIGEAKFRILISKKIIPSIKKAYFEGLKGTDYSIPVFDLGDELCLEIPLAAIATNNTFRMDRIVLIKG